MHTPAIKALAGAFTLSLAAFGTAQLSQLRQDADPTNSNFVKDGVISANEYGVGNSQEFLGSGFGFGGTVGGGALYMDFSATRLNVGFRLGNSLNDLIVILVDSRAGGFTDSDMDDQADGGRRISSNLTRDANDVFFPSFLPDFSIVIGNFGIVSFELKTGSLNFLDFDGTFTGNNPSVAREYSISRSLLALDDPLAGFDFIVGYGSDTGFMSDESIPIQGFTGTGNLGFGQPGQTIEWLKYNRFEAVPEPGTMLALGAALAAVAARRRRS